MNKITIILLISTMMYIAILYYIIFTPLLMISKYILMGILSLVAILGTYIFVNTSIFTNSWKKSIPITDMDTLRRGNPLYAFTKNNELVKLIPYTDGRTCVYMGQCIRPNTNKKYSHKKQMKILSKEFSLNLIPTYIRINNNVKPYIYFKVSHV